MKAVILAGGFGTRISEESAIRPKPMVEIGGKPILWHIMRFYASHGFTEFIVACGYKGEMIRDFVGDGSRWGVDVTYIRSILIPGDETCFHVFEAATAEAVAAVGVRVAVPMIRVVEAVERPQQEEK